MFTRNLVFSLKNEKILRFPTQEVFIIFLWNFIMCFTWKCLQKVVWKCFCFLSKNIMKYIKDLISTHFVKQGFPVSFMQSKLFKQPPISDDHSSKTTNDVPAQANSHTIVPMWDDHLFNKTSDHFLSLKWKMLV